MAYGLSNLVLRILRVIIPSCRDYQKLPPAPQIHLATRSARLRVTGWFVLRRAFAAREGGREYLP
jgi:hypothetical protein